MLSTAPAYGTRRQLRGQFCRLLLVRPQKMMSIFTRDDAIEWLHAKGIEANKRNWSFGESVVAGILRSGFEGWQRSVCIFPSEGQWYVQILGDMKNGTAVEHKSLLDATIYATKIISQNQI